MKFSKYSFKAVTPVMALFQKQHRLLFKQGYDNLRSTRGESAASADTARSGRCFRRNQSAVCASHNVPSDSIIDKNISLITSNVFVLIIFLNPSISKKATMHLLYDSILIFPRTLCLQTRKSCKLSLYCSLSH